MLNKTIALVANYSYVHQVETTIKSVLCHNSNITFYLLNSDIPQEWFSIMSNRLKRLNSEIIDRKVDPGILVGEHISQQHLNPIAYAKFLIPEKVPSDKVLYLDSDIIVKGNIEPLFHISFSDNELLAMAHEVENDSFNSGVIVFNNKKLRENKNLASETLQAGKNSQLINGDQTVMNEYFKGHIKEISSIYNFEIGMDRWAQVVGNHRYMLDKLNAIHDPIIIHYANDDKPWNEFSTGRLRRLWWYYYGLEWSDVRSTELPEESRILPQDFKRSTFTLTASQDIAHIESLVKALPNWHFQIAAFTVVGFELAKLIQYKNVSVYPVVNQYRLDHLMSDSDVYLDINYSRKFPEFIEKFLNSNRPVFAFSSSKGDFESYENYHVISDDKVDRMVFELKRLEIDLA